MLRFSINISRRAVAYVGLVAVAVAISSLGVVRAEREGPDTKVFNCTSGKACVEGNASGKNVEGVFGNSASGTGVQGNSTATNKNSGVAGVNTATAGTGYGVYGRSSNGPGMYGTSAVTTASRAMPLPTTGIRTPALPVFTTAGRRGRPFQPTRACTGCPISRHRRHSRVRGAGGVGSVRRRRWYRALYRRR